MFYVDYFIKNAELDNYEEGVSIRPEDGYYTDYGLKIIGDDIPELIEMIKHHFNVNTNAITLDTCDEIGRLDIQLMENEDAEEPSEAQYEAFKRGECKLWAVTYTTYLKQDSGDISWHTSQQGDTIAIPWHIDDIKHQNPNVTDAQARIILQNIKKSHDAEIGINWGVIDIHIDSYLEAEELK